MKLRIRSIATKETISVTLPDTSSLHDLKTLIATSLADASPNPNPIAPASIHLSLNRTDELVAPNAADALSSLGLTSGDLLFLSFSAFPKTLVVSSPAPLAPPMSVPHGSGSGSNSGSNDPIGNLSKENAVNSRSIDLSAGTSAMDVDVDVDADPTVLKVFDDTLGFLVRVMGTGTGEGASILGQVVLLTHAALLDMGFTHKESGSDLPQGWSSQASSLCLKYTISSFLDQVQEINEKVAVLKFSVLGNLVTVYGYVGGVKPDIHRFCFDLAKVAALFSSNLNSLSKSEQGELMEIFRGVKDTVSLPLMIDLCLKNGLPLPPCFMSLSVDMKSRILDLLPGVDAVRAGSTCKEMQNLSLDENMWRQKMEREFSSSLNDNTIKALGVGRWREKYKRAYIKKQSALRSKPRGSRWYQSSPSTRPFGSGQHFFSGGYSEMFPVFVDGGYAPAFGAGGYADRFPAFGRQVSPCCDFEGSDDLS